MDELARGGGGRGVSLGLLVARATTDLAAHPAPRGKRTTAIALGLFAAAPPAEPRAFASWAQRSSRGRAPHASVRPGAIGGGGGKGSRRIAGAVLFFAGATLYVAVSAAPLLADLVIRYEAVPLSGTGAGVLRGGGAVRGSEHSGRSQAPAALVPAALAFRALPSSHGTRAVASQKAAKR